LSRLRIVEAIVKKRKSAFLKSLSDDVHSSFCALGGDEFLEAFISRIENDFCVVSGVASDLIVETGHEIREFHVPGRLPVSEGDHICMIAEEDRLRAIINLRTGRVFKIGFEPIPSSSIERAPIGALLASVASSIMFGSLAYLLVGLVTNEGSAILFWLESGTALGCGIIALLALPIWFYIAAVPKFRRFADRSRLDQAIRREIERVGIATDPSNAF
jgi:hypothetical protein